MRRLDLHDTPLAGLRRLCRRLLAQAQAGLVAGAAESGVHGSRRRLKLLRSLIRLARPGLAPAQFAATERPLRRAARALAPARHAEALRETLAALAPAPDAAAVAAVRRAVDEVHAVTHRPAALADAAAAAAAALAEAEAALAAWRFRTGGRAPVLAAVTASYARARREIRRGLRHDDRDELHAGRTALIRFLHQVEVMTPLWPALFAPWVAALDQFRTVLGELNDLDEFEAFVAAARLPQGVAAGLAPGCERRRAALNRQAAAAAAALLAERPGDLRRRLAALWKVARR